MLVISTITSAQQISIDNSKTPDQLIQGLFNTGSCVQPTNITINGYNFGSGQQSYAWFESNGSGFPLQNGLVISTGKANSAIGPNTSLLSEGPMSWAGDNDLEAAINESNTVNATIVEFDFVAVTNYMSFNYIFSSEQYLSNPGSNQCNYSDGFAFLLKQNSQPSYQNLAVVPGTNIPVKVTTVRGSGTICPAANQQYFDAFNGTNHPTNFNGQTKVLVAEADIIPGVSYHIKMVIADQQNNLYDSAIFIGGNTFSNEFALGDDRLLAAGNPLCPGETLTVTPDYIVPGTIDYTWFKNGTPIPGYSNVSSPTYTITSPGVYKVQANLTGCTVNGYINVEYAQLTAVNSSLSKCDDNNDNIASFNLNDAGNSITGGDTSMTIQGFYTNLTNAQNLQNSITNPSNYSGTGGNSVVARIENNFSCVGYATVSFQVLNSNALNPINPFKTCDEDSVQDGLHQFDLTEITQDIEDVNVLPTGASIQYFLSEADATILNNPLSSPFSNTQPDTQTIYAQVINSTTCYEVLPIVLQVNSFDPEDFEDELFPICENTAVTLDAGSGFSNYSWDTTPIQTTQTITVNTAGNYNVTVTNAYGCQATKKFIVAVSEIPTITSIEVVSFSSNGSGNSITVITTGNGDYEYSLDNVTYQDSNVFYGVFAGEYTIYVRDKNGCGMAPPGYAYVLDYPNFFTPNGDGFNDRWMIKNLDIDYPNSELFIFDRYGRLLKQLSPSGIGWDGQIAGQQFPSTDYWFVLDLKNGRTVKGHFSLKR
ncbi:choice-of-anchor L domain-containing protein [Flavobacterium sp.]|uniref:choice-of-anchor L domain-containing protein n=1 Tax=Flavobacterium sp. TaxID=239 RepID=UPI0028BE8F39|nr:choice-of-anchor L domain-containing protein [Flavobacterium sp.]